MNLAILAAMAAGVIGMNAEAPNAAPILFETDTFILGISADGQVVRFADRISGADYCDRTGDTEFAVIRRQDEVLHPVRASHEGDLLTLDFGGSGGRAVLRVIPENLWLVFAVQSVDCEGAEELVFARIPLQLDAGQDAPFAVSPLALNLKTNCSEIPGLCSDLSGFTAYKRFGFEGAQGAVIACPATQMRDALTEAVKSSPELVYSPLGGPSALDAGINQGSYLIAAEEHVTEENVGEWIAAARGIGASQIDLHGGKAFRWGDFEVNREIYPRGRESLRAVVDAIHAAGLSAGLHTYAFFVAKDTPWVTPVPDPDLDTDAEFTLAAELTESDTAVLVNEDTGNMSAVTGFQVRNSATLRIGDELIAYTGVDKNPPYAFTGCVRGAHGTQAVSHSREEKVRHLKECFGLFVPAGDSPLFLEVVQRTADLYNACGFDMLYLDALDGADILAGPENAWHYSAKFVYELTRRLAKPPVMEMSTFSHHLWCVRSRMQAWDCPARAAKQFVDCHVAQNRQWKNAFLPTHLGWWGVFQWNGIQPERSMPDDLEYLCAKALATDSSLSYIVGFTPKNLQSENTRRLAEIARRYEELRVNNGVPDSIKARLASPGEEFTLETAGDSAWQFRPVSYRERTIALGKEAVEATVTNPYGAQPLRMRIEVLLSPAAYSAPESEVLEDWANADAFGKPAAQPGVTGALTRASGQGGDGDPAAALTARNDAVEADRAWATFEHAFTPPRKLTQTGLGLWVEGDGQGAVLNLQLRASIHLAGGFADHYIPLDFTGWRYFALVEPESDALSAYEWAHTRRRADLLGNAAGVTAFAYPMYHFWVDYGSIAAWTVGINNVAPGGNVQARMSPVKALPLRTAALPNPSVTLGGKTLTFPVTLESGSFLEFNSAEDCRIYDAAGNSPGGVVPTGDAPLVETGNNVFLFGNTQQGDTVPRAKVTIILRGEPLAPSTCITRFSGQNAEERR